MRKIIVNNIKITGFVCLFILFSFTVFAQENDDITVDSIESDVSGDVTQDQECADSDLLTDEFNEWYLHSPWYFSFVPKKWLAYNKTKLGLSLSRGNTHSFTVDGNNQFVLRKKLFSSKLTVGALYSRGKDFSNNPPATLSRFFIVEEKINYDFHKRYYAFMKAGWQTDKAAGMDHDIKYVSGFGYNVFETPHHTLQFELAYQFNREMPVAPNPKESIHSILSGIDWTWFQKEDIKFEQQFSFISDVQTASNFRFKSDSEMSVRIIKHFGVGVGVVVSYDNEPILGYEKYDLQTSVSALMEF